MIFIKEFVCGLCYYFYDIFKYLSVFICIIEFGFFLDFYSDIVLVDGVLLYKGYVVKYFYKIIVGISRV